MATDGSGDRGGGSGDHLDTWKGLNGDTLLEEANALAMYLGRHGEGLFRDATAESGDADPYGALLDAIAEATSSPSASSWRQLIRTYAVVSSVTYEKRGVNGRSVLDTAHVRWRHSASRPLMIGVSLFLAALVVHAIPHLSVQALDGFWVRLVHGLSPLLVPALWGGVGACTFLAKHLSNKLSEQAYELARQRGDIVRIFLGAMIGVFAVVVLTDVGTSVTELNDGNQDGPAPIKMGAVVVAFASGLAVKPIYAAIETLANALASRLGGK